MAAEYKRKDALYEQAKQDGYRSRAAYKLIELQKRFRLCNNSARVLDLGAWPGGWLQVASDLVGPKGTVVGIDLANIEPRVACQPLEPLRDVTRTHFTDLG